MKFVFILENDKAHIKEILEALGKIDDKLQTRVWATLADFEAWMVLWREKGPERAIESLLNPDSSLAAVPPKAQALPVAPGPAQTSVATPVPPEKLPHILGFICDEEILKDSKTFKSIQDFFLVNGLCPKDSPTPIVVTAYDKPGFDPAKLDAAIVNNVIFKPFDKLILQQDLIIAFGGRLAATEHTLHNMKTSAVIEMLKDVHVEAFSEVGFITRSSQSLTIGQVAKYYSDIFKVTDTRSVMARCFRSEVHPQFPEMFRCGFTFFGETGDQLRSFRKNGLQKQEVEYQYTWRENKAHGFSTAPPVNLIVIDPDEFGPTPLSGTLGRLFSNSKVHSYRTLTEFLGDLNPAQAAKNAPAAKAFPVPIIKFYFHGKTHKLIKMDHELTLDQKIFGLSAEEWKKLNFQKILSPENLERLNAMIRGQVPGGDQAVLRIQQEGPPFLVRCQSYSMVKGDDGGAWAELTFVDLSDAERAAWLSSHRRFPKDIAAVIAHDRFVGHDVSAWGEIKKQVEEQAGKKRVEFFLLAPKMKDDSHVRKLGQVFTDCFHAPMDRSHFAKKMFLYLQNLRPTEAMEIKQFGKAETIEVGNPIKVTEISESGLVMEYYRPIRIGAYRRFVLWFPVELGIPTILGACNFSEKKGEGAIHNHFVFFGIRDQMLKHIRMWIRENYILQKSGQ